MKETEQRQRESREYRSVEREAVVYAGGYEEQVARPDLHADPLVCRLGAHVKIAMAFHTEADLRVGMQMLDKELAHLSCKHTHNMYSKCKMRAVESSSSKPSHYRRHQTLLPTAQQSHCNCNRLLYESAPASHQIRMSRGRPIQRV